MPYIVTVMRRTAHKATDNAARTVAESYAGTEFKCFEQEFADDQFNMSKFVLSLNKPQRKRGPKPKKEAAS
jgi:hypothetical protein